MLFGGVAVFASNKVSKADETSYTCIFEPEPEVITKKLMFIEKLWGPEQHPDHCHQHTYEDLPIGTVQMWEGKEEDIPNGWARMDGSSNSKERNGTGKNMTQHESII